MQNAWRILQVCSTCMRNVTREAPFWKDKMAFQTKVEQLGKLDSRTQFQEALLFGVTQLLNDRAVLKAELRDLVKGDGSAANAVIADLVKFAGVVRIRGDRDMEAFVYKPLAHLAAVRAKVAARVATISNVCSLCRPRELLLVYDRMLINTRAFSTRCTRARLLRMYVLCRRQTRT